MGLPMLAASRSLFLIPAPEVMGSTVTWLVFAHCLMSLTEPMSCTPGARWHACMICCVGFLPTTRKSARGYFCLTLGQMFWVKCSMASMFGVKSSLPQKTADWSVSEVFVAGEKYVVSTPLRRSCTCLKPPMRLREWQSRGDTARATSTSLRYALS